MPTVRSWRNQRSVAVAPAELRRGMTDLRWVLRFRTASLTARSRRRLLWAGALLIALTLMAGIVPAYVRDQVDTARRQDLLLLTPTLYLALVVLAAVSAIAAGGGREVIPREQMVAYPLSAVTEHLGALLLAPLNIAWLLQTWTVLGVTSFVLGPMHLWAPLLTTVVWVAFATATGQIIGWAFEGVRRGPGGVWVARGLVGLAALIAVAVVATGNVSTLLDASPTTRVFLVVLMGSGGAWVSWLTGTAILIVLAALATVVGVVPASWALRRPQREELRLESGQHSSRPNPTSDLRAMLRLDRASMWRSVPLRRGVAVLALMPGMIALTGVTEWRMVTMLPGLVASGAALLFGVNAWSLDGRGALWRDSLPGTVSTAYWAKVVVVAEVLLVSAMVTLLLAALRAGRPTAAEVVAAVGATLVITLQVTFRSLRWSIRRPFTVDLRSARATPAPPVVMAGYSAKLAVGATFTGLFFSWAGMVPDWRLPALLAVAFLCWTGYRLLGLEAEWATAPVRSQVISTVAA